MTRSEINRLLRETLTFLAENRVVLPRFAFWSPEEWQSKGDECADIVRQSLGWDITDFGSGDYERCGLLLFTLRNGAAGSESNKPYGEKLLVVENGQVTPTHYHPRKQEDIIHRGGDGVLVLNLWSRTDADTLADTPVTVAVDGVRTVLSAGGELVLRSGESVCLPAYLWHTFWARGGRVLAGEVSTVNDDTGDNRFLEPVGRFPLIDDDETPLHLLIGDYERYYSR